MVIGQHRHSNPIILHDKQAYYLKTTDVCKNLNPNLPEVLIDLSPATGWPFITQYTSGAGAPIGVPQATCALPPSVPLTLLTKPSQ